MCSKVNFFPPSIDFFNFTPLLKSDFSIARLFGYVRCSRMAQASCWCSSTCCLTWPRCCGSRTDHWPRRRSRATPSCCSRGSPSSTLIISCTGYDDVIWYYSTFIAKWPSFFGARYFLVCRSQTYPLSSQILCVGKYRHMTFVDVKRSLCKNMTEICCVDLMYYLCKYSHITTIL